ncbi:hypothetical protein C8C83_0074 [Flavobacterium sp. 90]|uniref:hypothetical protein n=1 Tax=unclassified Flavobacterium TaxID=196869 RepID=UPI000EB4C22E|nr:MULTISPECIES: hypothetical protein [unclassified Flavobacterium]RKR08490.1 hypothetical protein C8C82_0364 [Flavobacterium sp. 81]TCK52284.1 hypothetical protein C8C83_0074 [Flavobacterium sp. 90]
MKAIVLKSFIFFFSVYVAIYGQSKKTSFYLEENDNLNIVLNGKVKSVKIKKENLINKANADSLVYLFNAKGNAETIVYYGLGMDLANRRIRVEEVHYTFKENKIISKLNKMEFGIDGDVYEYDDNWNLIHLKNYYNNVLVKENFFKYDNYNRKIENVYYLYGGFSNYNEQTQENKSSFLYEIEKYKYNTQNKPVLVIVSNFRDNKSIKVASYDYDEKGNLIQEGNCYGSENCDPKPLFGYEYDSKSQITKKYQFAKFSPHNTDEYHVYDDKGREIESKGMYVYTDKLPYWGYHYIYQYDEFGNKTKDEELIGKYRMLGREKYKTQSTQYDKFNNIISDEYITAEGTTIQFISQKYIYDKMGNWVSREKLQGKNKNELRVIEIYTREIKYYH